MKTKILIKKGSLTSLLGGSMGKKRSQTRMLKQQKREELFPLLPCLYRPSAYAPLSFVEIGLSPVVFTQE